MQKGRRKINCSELRTDTNKKNPQDIANTFACYFSDLYSSNDDPDIPPPPVDHIYNSKDPKQSQLKTI